MKHIQGPDFDTLVLHADKPVLVDFTATWCGPCKMQKPVLERYAATHPELDVVCVDVDAWPEISSCYHVQAMPTLVLFRNGEAQGQIRGLQSDARINAFVSNALAR
jgi:thioredoxin